MIYDEKIKTLKETIETNRKSLLQLDAAVDQVMARSADERGAERSNQIRKAQQKERTRASDEIIRSQKEIQSLTEEKSPISLEIKKAASELGPIKYVAELFYGQNDTETIDKAVRMVIVILVFVFDPLAILLVIGANMLLRQRSKVKKSKYSIEIDKSSVLSLKNTDLK